MLHERCVWDPVKSLEMPFLFSSFFNFVSFPVRFLRFLKKLGRWAKTSRVPRSLPKFPTKVTFLSKMQFLDPLDATVGHPGAQAFVDVQP